MKLDQGKPMPERTITMTADQIATLRAARDICLARQHDHVSLSAAVSVLTSVLRRVSDPTGGDAIIEMRKL